MTGELSDWPVLKKTGRHMIYLSLCSVLTCLQLAACPIYGRRNEECQQTQSSLRFQYVASVVYLNVT